MTKYIKCSSFNSKYKYILICCFFGLLCKFLFGYYHNENFEKLKFFRTNFQIKISYHVQVHDVFRYLSILIISIIIHKYQQYHSNKLNEKPTESRALSSSSGRLLIHNDIEKEFKEDNSSLSIFLANSLYIIHKILTTFYNKIGLSDLDYWMFELLIISYLNNKMFKKNTYMHQKCGIYFNIIACLPLKILSFLITFNSEKKPIYRDHEWFIPIGIIFYFVIMLIRSYGISKMKYLMDLKYISPIKLLISYGKIGSIYSIIICSISTFVKCTNNYVNNNLCTIKYSKSDKNIYLDNFIIYFKKLFGLDSKEDYSLKETFFEIISTILGVISNFWYIYFYIYVIKYLSPVHVIFSRSLYYLFIHLLLIINNLILIGKFFLENKRKEENRLKFIIDFSSNVLSIIGFMIYLEIIELNFWGCNYNLEKYIRNRSTDDTFNINKFDGNSLTDEEEEEDDNEQINERVNNDAKNEINPINFEMSVNKKES